MQNPSVRIVVVSTCDSHSPRTKLPYLDCGETTQVGHLAGCLLAADLALTLFSAEASPD